MTEFNRTEKDITPMGRFPHYGILKEDYQLIQGCCVAQRSAWLWTKFGHRHFQTTEEKNRFYVRLNAWLLSANCLVFRL
ncbi:hypothetical protein MLD38_032236 [Melastoma candidum]|uniref:Uncharacterized protein n=1 Tax=Melastoma candidum TaxID=119954 RepID=A0ACB9M3M7_9MYRT|nr:hypothetical protein MLD38_032236 [Melastoma candidum]